MSMFRTADRRAVLKAALGGAVACALPGLSGHAFAQSARVSAAPLGGRLALLSGAGANVLALDVRDGVVLVDSGAPGATDALIEALNGARVSAVFNTHYHLDQTGGNAAFRRAGANIVAHKRTWQWMANRYWVPGEFRWEDAREPDALPTETFYETGAMDAGNERIEYGYLLEAHTSGDIYVFFRDANVIGVGDVASPERDIAIDWYTGAWTGARLDAMEAVLAMADETTRIVPAYGPVMTRAEFQAEYDMLKALHEAMVVLVRRGYSAADMEADGIMLATGRDWADPSKFLYDACKGLWGHQNALSPDIV